MRPGDILRKMNANISQRISGLLFNIPKSSKKRRKRNEEHPEEAVEIWKAKKRKANFYHNPVLSSYKCQNSSPLVNSPKKSENATNFTKKIPIEHYNTTQTSNLKPFLLPNFISELF